MRTYGSNSRPIITAVLVAVLSVSLAGTGSAYAVTNAKIEARKAEAAEAQNHVEDLQADLEERAEEYAEIAAALEKTNADLSQADAELDEQTERLRVMNARLSRRAAAIYRSGGLQALTVFIGVRDFEDLSSRMDLMARIGRADASTVSAVKDARQAVERIQASLESRKAEQLVLRESAEVKKAQVEEALQAQSSYLSGLKKDLAKLITEERERQRKLAEERARQAAAAAAAAAAARAKADTPVAARTSGPLGSPHPEVIAVAMRYLGVQYVWGGTSPSGFDCSGLCQYSYAELGISLPRTSREQFKVGSFIPPNRRDLLEPGDLVFFGRDGDPDRVHHVGIYSGGGNFIEAPYTGGRVQVTSLDGRIDRRGDYVGAHPPVALAPLARFRLPFTAEATPNPQEAALSCAIIPPPPCRGDVILFGKGSCEPHAAIGQRGGRAWRLGSGCHGRRGLSGHALYRDPCRASPRSPDVYAEWSPNEKVALEVAAGASFAGRACVCDDEARRPECGRRSTVHVGLHRRRRRARGPGGGRPGDALVSERAGHTELRRFRARADPGAVRLSGGPRLHPDGVRDLGALRHAGDRAIHRTTLAFEGARRCRRPTGPGAIRLPEGPRKVVMMPAMAKGRRVDLDRRIAEIQEYARSSELNRIEMRDTSVGVVCSGVVYQYVREALPDASTLKLGMAIHSRRTFCATSRRLSIRSTWSRRRTTISPASCARSVSSSPGSTCRVLAS